MKQIYLILFSLLIILPLSLFGQNKTALVIGNSNYIHCPSLTNPNPEAIEMKETLQRIGFEVILLLDGTQDQMLNALSDFEEKIEENGGLALFHYGGHGVQVNGINYLIPVNADIPDERRVRSRSVDVDEILGAMEVSGSDTNIIILDACRNNPLPSVTRSISKGLAIISNPPPNSIIIYAADAGTTARDGLFTPTFLKYLGKPDLEIGSLLRQVRLEVSDASNGRQRTGEYNQLIKEVYLAGKTSPVISDEEISFGSIRISVREKGVIYLDSDILTEISANATRTIGQISTGIHELEISYGGLTEKKTITINKDKSTEVNFLYRKLLNSESMVFVQGGTYQMGSNNGDNIEKPVHTVTVGSFYISKYEVTQEEYQIVMGDHYSFHQGNLLPVEKVSWFNAVEYCNALSLREGLSTVYNIDGNNVSMNIQANGYRLPTEAEWEFAARGGIMSRGFLYGGHNEVDAVAWYWKNSGDQELSGDWDYNAINNNECRTHPVGVKEPNELGLFDMNGNVAEWCWDWFGEYSNSLLTDPTGITSGEFRIKRGGSWGDSSGGVRSTSRGYGNPANGYYNLGFRVVRNP